MSDIELDGPRPCTLCKGSGVASWDAGRACYACAGRAAFDAPDMGALVRLVTTTRGASAGRRRFRAACPKNLCHYSTRETRRAYFVWRLARFHGGADVTLPMTAEGACSGDPYRPELDALASAIARAHYGARASAGAARWGALLGAGAPGPGLEASAYESGPVADEHKPAHEAAERGGS
jgi:hypothetical protein